MNQFDFTSIPIFMHLLANGLIELNELNELNKLNRKFQYDMVDITTIASTMDVTISLSQRNTWTNRLEEI